ncbi:MAG: hypothetical protein LBK77_07595, partial [Spirochaetaceae bacterium]|nr:hypothetical protein [Spirochaetaceae bacterium]
MELVIDRGITAPFSLTSPGSRINPRYPEDRAAAEVYTEPDLSNGAVGLDNLRHFKIHDFYMGDKPVPH